VPVLQRLVVLLTRRQQILLATPFLVIVIPFLICPAVFGVVASFTDYAPFQPSLEFVGLQNYMRVVNDPTFIVAVRNAAFFTVVTVLVEMVIGVGLAYTIRQPFRGRTLLRFIFLLPWLISPAASGVMWHQLLNTEHGLLNFWPALVGLPPLRDWLVTMPLLTVMIVEVWRKFPLVSFLVLPGLQAISVDQWDNARLDGLRLLAQIRYIVLPHLRLLLLTITLLLAGDALGVSESVFFLTGGGPGAQTMMPGLYSYNKAIRALNWSSAAIPGWLVALTVVILGLGYIYFTRMPERP
jgi:multiple sugar transport system permease protein